MAQLNLDNIVKVLTPEIETLERYIAEKIAEGVPVTDELLSLSIRVYALLCGTRDSLSKTITTERCGGNFDPTLAG